MSGKILVVLPDSTQAVLDQVVVPDEAALHDQLKRTPALLPIEALGLEGPMLVVGHETSLASGRIDLVGVVRSGDVLLIEFKTGPQNPDFRAALAQLLDYGSDLWGSSVEGFDNAVVRRYLSSSSCTDLVVKGAQTLSEAVRRQWLGITDEEVETFNARLATVLAAGRFHFVVVAQRFTPSMESTARYLNSGVGPGDFYLVQLVRYNNEHTHAYAGQLVVQPIRKVAPGIATSIDEERFLGSLSDDRYRSVLERIFDACKANGLRFEWGIHGASIRMPSPDRTEPLSIGWIFSSTPSWQGLRDLTIGVDKSSLIAHPSVVEAVTKYADAALEIPGATAASAKRLLAAMFNPAAVTRNEAEIVSLISRLVETVNTGSQSTT